jgi:hypothetical protein
MRDEVDEIDELDWREELRAGGHDLEVRKDRRMAAVLFLVALGVLAFIETHPDLFVVANALDAATHVRRRSYDMGWIGMLPVTVGSVCCVVIWRAISRMCDTARMRVDRTHFTLVRSLLFPWRPGLELHHNEITQFDPKPSGFSTDVIPLGGGWDVAVETREGRFRLRLPLEDFKEAQFVAKRLNFLVREARALQHHSSYSSP